MGAIVSGDQILSYKVARLFLWPIRRWYLVTWPSALGIAETRPPQWIQISEWCGRIALWWCYREYFVVVQSLLYTGSAIFMATHILSSFSIKIHRNWKFIRWAYSQWQYNNKQKHLSNMANFIFNDRLHSTLESITGGTQYFLRDQGQFS